jgi:hypothetical protein
LEHFEKTKILSSVTLEYPQQKNRNRALNTKLIEFFRASIAEGKQVPIKNYPFKYEELEFSTFQYANTSLITAIGIICALWLLILLRK